MRLDFVPRLLRFLFWPICAMAAVVLLRHNSLYTQISEYCERRTECYAGCTNDNFPFSSCVAQTNEIEYNGVTYKDFFFYLKPSEDHSPGELNGYNKCKGYIDDVSRPQILGLTLSWLIERGCTLHPKW